MIEKNRASKRPKVQYFSKDLSGCYEHLVKALSELALPETAVTCEQEGRVKRSRLSMMLSEMFGIEYVDMDDDIDEMDAGSSGSTSVKEELAASSATATNAMTTTTNSLPSIVTSAMDTANMTSATNTTSTLSTVSTATVTPPQVPSRK